MRFFGVKNVGCLERDLDQLYIGNNKLFVNVPKYCRQQLEPAGVEGRILREPYRERKNETGKQDKLKHKPSPEQLREEKWVERNGSRSYADAVRGEFQKQWKGQSIKAEGCIIPWMERSVMGKLRDDLGVDQLGEELVKGGMNMVEMRSLGDNLVLLTPRAGENMEDVIKLNKEWIDNVFVSVKPWSADSNPSHKTVWVRCYGLPFVF